MKQNLVSIITPMYNAEKYVAQTIESVLAQTYSDWEMIIVNDGSKDNCAEIVKEYTQKDKRIKLINQPNSGSASARNNALRNAVGQYICFLDADDLWDNNFLEKQINFLKEKNAVLVFSSYRRIDEKGEKKLDPFIVPKTLRDDFVFWLQALKKVKKAYGNTKILASYRVFASSTTGNKKKVIRPQFMVYYKVEKLGLIKSLYYLGCWAINGFLKYRK